MRLSLFVFILIITILLSTTIEAKNCKKGQPCGNSCISWKKTCRIGNSNNSYNSTKTYKKHSMPVSNYSNSSKLKSNENSYKEIVKYVVITNRLNVRSKPDTFNSILGVILKGTHVVSIQKDGEWRRILYNKQLAWVNVKYLKPI